MITIGTDCSGIEAPIEALKQLKVPFRHLWSCEIDKFARASIEANYKPEVMYTDITKRDHSTLPDVDIYVCGFPCQPFSLMGKKKGTNDIRSNIMVECIEVIKTKKPRVFILENVKNFVKLDKGYVLSYLLNELNSITHEDEPYYDMCSHILNTKHYGIPQHRERLYIIGVAKGILKTGFKAPDKISCKKLDDFILDKRVIPKPLYPSLYNNLVKIDFKNNYVVTPFRFWSAMQDMCPTLTTQCSKFYLTTYKRNLLSKECLLLQGFPKTFKQVVSNTQLYKQAGNSMSVNVLKVVFEQVFKVAEF